MKYKIILLISVFLVLCSASQFLADDQQFFSYYVKPEIWLVLDTSGSMATGFGGDSRLYVAKDAIYQVINDPDINIRWGFATFYQEYVYIEHWWWGEWTWKGSNHNGTEYTPEYAYKAFFIRTPMGEPDSTHRAEISAWVDHIWEPDSLELEADGYTPLPNVLRGAYVRFRKDISEDTTGARWCRKFYVMLVTDGEPTHGIDPDTYYEDTLAKWDANAPDKLGQTCKEADSLRNLRIPASGGNPAQTIEVKTYVIGVGPGLSNLNQIAEHGGTEHYYPANNPQELQDALEEIIYQIIKEATSYSGGEVTSIEEEFINTNYEARMYVCSFIPSMGPLWEGHLKAVKLTAGSFQIDSIPDSLIYWDGGEILNATVASDRTIYTEMNGYLVPFDEGNIEPSDLGVTTDEERDSIINTVYSGSPTGSTGYLGDIFHSTPLRIHGPRYFYEDDDFYIFRDSINATRDAAIYAGANDGMLHCFSDSTGEELWAFIPNDQLLNLKNLLVGHNYYQDANSMAADVWFPTSVSDTFKNANEWNTILMLGQRQGGPNYSALEVTDPYNPNFAYRFDTTMAELGLTFSDPVTYKVHKDSFDRKNDRFFTFIGGGYWPDTLYDPYDPSSALPYGNGFYALDVYNMSNTTSPIEGTDYWKIPPSTDYADSMFWPFPSQASIIDTNLDTYADILYIGDWGGQLWKVNINGQDSLDIIIDNWEANIMFKSPRPSTFADSALWQPIFYPATYASDGMRWWVYFGTGDRARAEKDSPINRFYALIDSNYTSPVTEADLKRISNDDPLTEEEIQNGDYKGWYIIFTDFNPVDTITREGEKVVSQATVLLDTVIFTTFQPYENTDPCATASGIARLYKIHYKTGDFTNNGEIIGSGLPQAPRYSFDISGEGYQIINLPGEIIIEETQSIGIRRKLLWWQEKK
jgi:type IV pilus assembly protein PilY1